ncbi:HAMP domain-containing protein [Azospirillum sp. INR13]|uniref:HAMP domain-containing protein n=1 Tax=Azospirillum sp. INR13 TaxID=2596919 RepID=UPI00210454DA|nr:HAMP domain-containing protein [Azospirillum sp. INR13]
MVIAIGAAVALLLGALMAWIIDRAITHPLHAMTGAMGRLAEGDLTVEIPGGDRKDEMRHMADAMTIFKDNALEMQRMEREREEMRIQIDADRRRTMNEFATASSSSVRRGDVADRIGGVAGSRRSGDVVDAALTTAKSTAVATARNRRPRMSRPSPQRRRSCPPPSPNLAPADASSAPHPAPPTRRCRPTASSKACRSPPSGSVRSSG